MFKTRLESILNQAVNTTGRGSPPPVYVGVFSLIENPYIALNLLNQYAEFDSAFPTFEQFKKLFKEPKLYEKEPKQGDKQCQPDVTGLSPKERQIKQLYFLHKAQKKYQKAVQEHETKHRLARAFQNHFEPTESGYLAFAKNPDFNTDPGSFPQSLPENERAFLSLDQSLYLPEKSRRRHTYMTAKSGHGKSVNMEVLVRHYQTVNRGASLIVFDPHNDFAEACARYIGNLDSDRLVYIKPAMSDTHTPVFNPFDISFRDDRKKLAKAADALFYGFETILKADSSGGFTTQMETLLIPCITTLMHMEGTTFLDLLRFLDDDPEVYRPYLDYAFEHLQNRSQLNTLSGDFKKDTFGPTKLSIKTKLRNLLNDDYFYNFMIGKSTYDLESLVEQRKIILVDLSDITKKGKESISRFLMSSLANLAISRSGQKKSERTPTHIFIDECQSFVTPSMEEILNETRKFGLHATFAQQTIGAKMSKDLKEAVINNSDIKIMGLSGNKELNTVAKEVGVSVSDLQSLAVGEFFVKYGETPAIKVRFPFLGDQYENGDDHHMSDQQWEKVKQQQLERYYRPPMEDLPDPTHSGHKAPPQRVRKLKDQKISGVKPHRPNHKEDLPDPFA